MKNALVTGCTGQDGALLSKLLLDKGYNVYGVVRRSSTPNPWRLIELDFVNNKNFFVLYGDLSDLASIEKIMKYTQYDEIYNLAAQSFVGSSWDMPFHTLDVTGSGAVRVFEAAKNNQKKTKIYQASSSEMFGGTLMGSMLDEMSKFNPKSPYAAAKALAHEMANVYRKSYGMFISCGILFNHESEFRGFEFVTRKVTHGVAKIHLGLSKKISLGNMSAMRDWGYAPDYVRGMWQMLQYSSPEDFVLATGKQYSIKKLCEVAFEVVGIKEWEQYVETKQTYMRPDDVQFLLGDAGKAKHFLSWSPKTSFEQMIRLMVEKDIERLKK